MTTINSVTSTLPTAQVNPLQAAITQDQQSTAATAYGPAYSLQLSQNALDALNGSPASDSDASSGASAASPHHHHHHQALSQDSSSTSSSSSSQTAANSSAVADETESDSDLLESALG